MHVRKFDIDDYSNGVADAVIKLGGVEKAAEILDTIWLEVQDWIKSGYAPQSCAKEMHKRTGLPMYELCAELKKLR